MENEERKNVPEYRGFELKHGAETIEKVRSDADAANTSLYMLQQMKNTFADLPESGWLQPGPFSPERQRAAMLMNGIAGALGLQPLFSKEQVAAGEELQKDQTRLGFELVRTIGPREAMQIIQQAIGATPGSQNTKAGFQRITESLVAAAERKIDYADYMNKYYSDNKGNLNPGTLMPDGKKREDAITEFNKINPSTKYADRAMARAKLDPRDIQGLSQATADERQKAITAIDKKYGKGTADSLLWRPKSYE